MSRTAWFLPEERAELDRWIDAGWVDVFRTLHPEEPVASTRGGGSGAARASGTSDGGSTTSSHRRLR